MPPPSLTTSQARDLVEHFGGQKPAAHALGIPASTFQYWLDPDEWKARARARYAANPEARKAQLREQYHSETGLQRASRLLRMRRTKALHRMAERESRRG